MRARLLPSAREDQAEHRIRAASLSDGGQTDRRMGPEVWTGGLEDEAPFRSFRVRSWVRFAERARRLRTACTDSGNCAVTETTICFHGPAGPRGATHWRVQTIHS